jgi:ribosomal protein L7/L12
MKTRAELVAECLTLRSAEGATEEDIIAHLRAQRCNKIDTIAILRDVFGLSLGRAKQLVHLSPTWKDSREKDDAFHEALVTALESEFRPSSSDRALPGG